MLARQCLAPSRPQLRPLWCHFYRSARPRAVLFVVDANDEARLGEANQEFHKMIMNLQLETVNPLVLVVANVKKAKGKLKESDLRDKLDLGIQYDLITVDARRPQDLSNLLQSVCQLLQRSK